MQKKLLALAVAGALVPAAAMAQSSVEIYGRANLGIDNYRATGATIGAAGNLQARNRVFDSGSRVGLRVNEGLGGGLRAFVVIETGVNIDAGGTAGQGGQTNASSGVWASRDSYVGLGGGWGDVRFGRQSIWWSNGVLAQTGANYIQAAADGIITAPGLLAPPVTRQSNVMSYNSPTFGGFNATVSYSPSDQESRQGEFTGVFDRGSIFGITGRYRTGALRAQLDYAVRQNVGNIADTENTGIKGGVGWAYAPGAQVSFVLGELENQAGAVSLKQRFHLLNWEHMMGQWQLLAQYYWNNEVSGLPGGGAGTRARAFTVGGKYFLSKRTGIYASLNNVRNDENSFADFAGGAYTSGNPGLSATRAGADVRVMAVGVQHNF